MLAAWSMGPRGDERADWRVAYQTHQLMATIYGIMGSRQTPPGTHDLLIDFTPVEEDAEEPAEESATAEEIEQSVDILNRFTRLARAKQRQR